MAKSYDEQKWKAFRQQQVTHLLSTSTQAEKDALLARALPRIIDLEYNKEEDKAALESNGYTVKDASYFLEAASRSQHEPLNILIATALAEGKLSAGKGVKLMGIKSAQEKREALQKEGLIQ